MAGESRRGSELLTAKYTEEDFEVLLTFLESIGVKLTDAFPYGVPALDGVSGTVQVVPELVSTLIDGLIQQGIHVMQLQGKGLPVDVFELTFQAGSARAQKR
jgi:hypothetical protein